MTDESHVSDSSQQSGESASPSNSLPQASKRSKGMKSKRWPITFETIVNDFFDGSNCLTKCANHYFEGNHKDLLSKLSSTVQNAGITKVLIIGNTFNYFASQITRQLYMEYPLSLPFSLACVELSEFYDYMLPTEPEPTLYIFISKSGSSRFLTASIDHLRLTKIDPDYVWLITNASDFPLNSYIQNILPIYVDREIVMGTKSFVNSIFVLYLLTQALFGNPHISAEFQAQFGHLIQAMDSYHHNWERSIKIIEEYLANFDYLYLIARDPASMGAASFGALHAKTFTQSLTEGIYISDFFHGPFQILEKKIRHREIRIILLVGEKTTNEATIYRLVKLINERAGKVLILSNNVAISEKYRDNPMVLIAEFDVEIPAMAPIFEIFILQLVLLKIAQKKGLLKE
ncbi:MAG: SIS domain-containing protein [Promethearchaeota archaeon]